MEKRLRLLNSIDELAKEKRRRTMVASSNTLSNTTTRLKMSISRGCRLGVNYWLNFLLQSANQVKR